MMAGPTKKPDRASRLGSAPKPEDETTTVDNNTEKAGNTDLVALNFKVPAEFKRDFKAFAAAHDMSGVDVFKKAFEQYKGKKNG